MVSADSFHPKFKSDLKKIDKSVAKEVKEKHLDVILKNPFTYEKLKGKLSHFYSYHFQVHSTQYRIAYKILENEEIVFYYMIASRENFYKKLTQRAL